MAEWRRLWRELGGALLTAGTGLAGAWYTAARTFVALDSRGQLVKTSPWNPFLWACIAAMLLGGYIVVSTIFPALPWFGRSGALALERKKAKYSLVYKNIGLRFGKGDKSATGPASIRTDLTFRNTSPTESVRYAMESMRVESGSYFWNLVPDDVEWLAGPGEEAGFRPHEPVFVIPDLGSETLIDISYTIRYGFADDATRYRFSHRLTARPMYAPDGEMLPPDVHFIEQLDPELVQSNAS